MRLIKQGTMANQGNDKQIKKSYASKGVFPHQMAFTLLFPIRNIFLSPKRLVERLELQDNMNVLEIGPGPGYFSIRIARQLTHGKLVLADIQQEMLDYAKKRITRKNLSNVAYHLCNGTDFSLPDNSFDRIFMVTVIGEVENKEPYVNEFRRMLREGGIVSISEMAGDPDKLSINEVKSLFENSGFDFCKMFGNERNYTINFRKI